MATPHFEGLVSHTRALRTLLKSSLNARRTTFALLYAGLATLLLGGVLGAALAQDTDYVRAAAVPNGFGVASQHVGDKAAYNLTIVRGDGQDPTVIEQERAAFFFEWLPPHDVRDRDGALRTVNELHLIKHETEGGKTSTFNQAFLLDATNGSLVASGQVEENHDLPTCDNTKYKCPNSQEIQLRSLSFSTNGMRGDISCLVWNALQGVRVDTDAEIPLLRHCSVTNYWFYEPIDFHAIAAEATEEGPEVVWERSDGGLFDAPPTIRVWLREDLPYPTKLVVEDQDREGTYLVFRLVGFQRGAQPLASEGPSLAAPLAPLVFSPRKPWGMEEAGLEHPFPFSKAYEWARTDPDNGSMREFLANHPKAYVARTDYSEHNDPQQERSRLWYFVLTDGHDTRTICVAQTTAGKLRTLAGGVSPVGAVPGGDPTNETKAAYRVCWGAPDHYPPIEKVPALMPTAASLQRAWLAYVSPEHATRPANDWGHTIWCGDEACKLVLVRYSAGANYQDVKYGSGLPGDNRADLTLTLARLSVGSDGKPVSVMEYTYERSTGDPPQAGQEISTASAELPAVTTGGWITPVGAYAAGVGLAAIVVGVAYWLWPSLKAGFGLALFSRIERPTVLDQPVRGEIAALVEAQPGIHFSEILRRLSLSHGSATHHLRKLVETGVLSVQAGDAYTCYFPKGRVDRRVMAATPCLRSETARKIVREATTRPGVSVSDLARSLGLARQSIHEHVERLSNAGLLTVEAAGRTVRIQATPLAAQTMTEPIAA